MTIPYKKCIDLTDKKVSSVSRVFRAQGYGITSDGTINGGTYDPMYMASWQMMAGVGSGISTMSSFVQNYAAYNTSLQVRNTLSTDLVFRFDKHTNQLYINCSYDHPELITIEYVPRYDDVSQIVSDFWIDIELKLALAICK